jgi:hypothetical protein
VLQARTARPGHPWRPVVATLRQGRPLLASLWWPGALTDERGAWRVERRAYNATGPFGGVYNLGLVEHLKLAPPSGTRTHKVSSAVGAELDGRRRCPAMHVLKPIC